MRHMAVAIWLGALLFGIVALFWRLEWSFALPTPVPTNYQVVRTGQHIDLPASIPSHSARPLLLHFFNPDCPCSKFNVDHFRSLVKQFGNKVDFVIVPVGKNNYSENDVRQRFRLDVPVLLDSTLAEKCGVYSTPQAVIIDENHSLYFRGNYNKSRYCANDKSKYAMIALDSLLQEKTNPVFSRYALKAYGCSIPKR